MTKTIVKLDDKYRQADGPVMIGALQAFVRLLLDQSRRDRAAGLSSAGYVTGYRGSPVTTLDAQLWAAASLLKEHDVRFEPGLNEELAATSLRGTQQLDWFGKARVDGVFALWYAKGIGVDRAHEALKLGNLEGSSAKGGVLLLAGDDHGAKSSASAHQSDQNLAAALIPTLYPATTEEILRYGQLGWALSRHAGTYCGFKTITDTLDLTSSVQLPGWTFPIHVPHREGPALNLREGMPALEQEALTVEHRLAAAQAFVRANAMDRLTHGRQGAALTIVTAGKAWLDVAQALLDLGLDEARCRKLGIAAVKLALTWPIDPFFAREACAGAREVMVVEEKRGWIEDQLARVLYGLADAPALTGKHAPGGEALLSGAGVLDAARVRRAIVQRLGALGHVDDALAARAAMLSEADAATADLRAIAARPAYFCSGCPHNRSTRVPEGSGAMGATGCHGLAHYMPARRTMQTVGMGSEGMPWVAAQHFVDTPHYFQNLGDGTYTHSGLLTIRASVAARSNVTFKILYNDAVAMTGGQPMEGALSPAQIAAELLAEGVSPVVLLSEDPARHRGTGLPPQVRVHHRDELDSLQRELREVAGTSALIYEQVCANEKRRRRKRGLASDPDMRLYINPAVCEGCGDCSVQSNCLSVEPVETGMGRKRRINQSSCNKDFSCIKGFCPSFVTVEGGTPARRAGDLGALDAMVAALPEPARAEPGEGGWNLLVTGIGGTGVLTVGAVLAMAAQIEGRAAKLLDMTGMAQKGGAVVSHLRIAQDLDAVPSARIGTGMADVVIACDLVVAAAPEVLAAQGAGTCLIANEDVVPTGEFQSNPSLDLSSRRFLDALAQRGDPARTMVIEATTLATRVLGDAIFANFVMLGLAAQAGVLPVSLEALDEALVLNGTAVAANRRAIALGRLAAHDRAAAERLGGLGETAAQVPQTLEAMLESRARHLADYQDEALAQLYRTRIADLQVKAGGRWGDGEDTQPLLLAAAQQLARLMAYKDEYEVARLFASPAFAQGIGEAFDGDVRLSLNLAPPLLPLGRDALTGRPRKVRFGGWMLRVMPLLAKGRRLRGTWLDPFGHTRERAEERALPGEYLAVLERALAAGDLAAATRIAQGAALIRGYGPVKAEGIAAWRALVAQEEAQAGRAIDRGGDQACPQGPASASALPQEQGAA
ncbi:indolepyruvate ferredoxin oxidoreductase family protein [Novosphingobium sp. YJ-S2-02]|uniref:Indolepyruvate ferredoxin oxidoreductase family protein n=1 Tax=Novosphingobium aureum TaxID=2792964 RepID=A0A931HEM3_9SPHN|nr:indolepyruvate ferredoxin oxidoreductase family protein [Novosphingobium aureum]MBH0114422.1 indolepyruvate ferredoxin oxidoreductase family protein [Novosphingobium aureum]